MTEQAAQLDILGLSKTYATKQGEIEAIREISLTLEPGELVCLVGPSGCGKTTLLRCIAGLLAPSGGAVLLGGNPVLAPPPEMAVVFQEYGRSLFPWLSVAKNVELPLRGAGSTGTERQTRVREALAAVGLEGTEDRFPWQLSGGMQQRVAIARAVAYQPRVLLMDEPFAAVDAQTRADLEDLIRSIWRRLGITVLFITHDIDESVYLGDRVVVLSNSPTIVCDEVVIDLPLDRDQLTTRSLPRFMELRNHVYEQIHRVPTSG